MPYITDNDEEVWNGLWQRTDISIGFESALSIGFFCPGYAGGLEDYPNLAYRLNPKVDIHIVRSALEEDAHRPDNLRQVGNVDILLPAVQQLKQRNVDAATWACTSGSFVFGADGARQQCEELSSALGRPVTSTSLAFVKALEALDIRSVSIAASYPEDLAELFANFISDNGYRVDQLRCLDIMTGVDVGRLSPEEIINFVVENTDPLSEAVLIPDTAMATCRFLTELDNSIAGTVLTANQVTLWDVLNLAGWEGSLSAGGTLFSSNQI